MITDHNDFSKKAYLFINKYINILSKYGQIYLTNEENGAAVWIPPLDKGKSETALCENIMLFKTFLRISGLKNLKKKLQFLFSLEKYYPPQPYFHLIYIGVNHNYRRRGIGTRLISPVLEYCKRERIKVLLENTNPDNCLFYQKLGFKTTKELTAPFGNLKIQLLLKN